MTPTARYTESELAAEIEAVASWVRAQGYSWKDSDISRKAAENLNTRFMEAERAAAKAEQQSRDATSSTVVVTGDTFEMRKFFKSNGFRWDADLRGWVGLYSRIEGRKLAGCRVAILGEAIYRDWSGNANSSL